MPERTFVSQLALTAIPMQMHLMLKAVLLRWVQRSFPVQNPFFFFKLTLGQVTAVGASLHLVTFTAPRTLPIQHEFSATDWHLDAIGNIKVTIAKTHLALNRMTVGQMWI